MTTPDPSNVSELMPNSFNAVFAGIEAKVDLKRALRLLWDAHLKIIELGTDDSMTALEVRESQHLFSTGEATDVEREYKIKLASFSRFHFLSKEQPKEIEQQDILASISILKYSKRRLEPINDISPRYLFARLAEQLNLEYSGMLRRLGIYSELLFRNGFRTLSFTRDQDHLVLAMGLDDVSVNITVYIQDYINTLFWRAHHLYRDIDEGF